MAVVHKGDSARLRGTQAPAGRNAVWPGQQSVPHLSSVLCGRDNEENRGSGISGEVDSSRPGDFVSRAVSSSARAGADGSQIA